MRIRLALLFLLALCVATVLPANAGVIYDNGPVNGHTDAWVINFGFIVADSFAVSGGGSSTLNSVSFGAWLIPGDILDSVEVTVASQPFGGTVYFDEVVSFTASGCALNQFSFNVCTETGSFQGPTLANGTYFLELSNAIVPSGDPVYWDENDGVGCTSPGCPSMAFANNVGSIPSESFTLSGGPSGTTPEPSSILLFGCGILGLTGTLRRKRTI